MTRRLTEVKSTWLLPLAVACFFTAGVVSKVGDTHGQGRAGAAPQAPVAPMPSAPAPVLTPEDGLKSLTIAPGYKVEIAAAEPLIHAPVAIQFGPDGRLWVVEMNGYSPVLGGLGEDDPNGRVVALRDRDGDGRYDEATVFLDNLVLPRSIMLVGDGVLVGAPPELAFWRDTNGDGKADTQGRGRQRLRREAQSEAAVVHQRRAVCRTAGSGRTTTGSTAPRT